MRVIPVWIRLPSLPLHCWGKETLSRIVGAVGVPVLVDDCTTKQLKVSYARVLVEVDITQEFVKEIKLRDNTGREFIQKAIPERRPFFCRKCNKMGHECKEPIEITQAHQLERNNEEEKAHGDAKIWMPKAIVNFMQGVTSVE